MTWRAVSDCASYCPRFSDEYAPVRPCSMTIAGCRPGSGVLKTYPVSVVVPSALMNWTMSGTVPAAAGMSHAETASANAATLRDNPEMNILPAFRKWSASAGRLRVLQLTLLVIALLTAIPVGISTHERLQQ